jgi:hypothetical protein
MDEIYKIMKQLNSTEELTQREISSRLGCSLGKVNYLIGLLVEK